MNDKTNNRHLPWVIALIILITISSYFLIKVDRVEAPNQEKVPEGIMILIEYQDTVGLANFVNEMEKRNIYGLLMVTPEFVQNNCEDIKEIIKHNVEIVASNVSAPFWDIPYDVQKTRITEMIEGIESCTGVPIRIISSRYMASDLTTIEVAEDLGIPYITARGTTDTKATVYQPKDYNVKVLSVSNIPLVTFKYGSLCDYSFFERSGTPDDMLAELNRALEPLTPKEKIRYGENHKITPVSHTRIGGYLEPWMNMWINFWDNSDVKWVSLDEFMKEPDWNIPLWQIPLNKNSPYTARKMSELVSYEDEEKIENPCAVINIGENNGENNSAVEVEKTGEKIVVFHNDQGSMCLDFLNFAETIDYKIEQHLNHEEDFYPIFNSYRNDFEKSEGVSESFGYYPMIFVKGRVFSGFNEDIGEEIKNIISN